MYIIIYIKKTFIKKKKTIIENIIYTWYDMMSHFQMCVEKKDALRE